VEDAMMSLLDVVYEYQLLRAKMETLDIPLDDGERARLVGLASLLRGEDLEGPGVNMPRVAGPMPVQFTVPGGFAAGEIRAVGGEGFAVGTTRPPAVGMRTIVRVAEPRAGHEYVFPCRIVWTNGPMMGLAFDGVPTRTAHVPPSLASWRSGMRFGGRRIVPQVA
jgi:hypothetical protein